ncbi:helix-turn-helix domain-containing protein [Shewanella sp. 0m-6]
MNTIYHIPAGQLTPFINTFVRIGVPIQSLLGSVGLSTSVLDHPSQMMPEYAAWKMVANISKQENINHLGMLVASLEQASCFDKLGMEAGQSQSLFAALSCLVNQLLQHTNYQNYWLSENERYIYLCRVGTPGICVGTWQMEQYVMSYFISVIKSYLGESWRPDFIGVQACRSEDQLSAFRDIKVGYSMPYGSIPIDKHDLIKDIDRSMFCSAQPHEYQTKQTSLLLTDMISNRIFEDNSSLENVSCALGTNSRKLQRALEGEGTTFREAKNRAMISLATQLLRDPSLTINDVSLELGYRNPKNFTRAFKAATGIAPREYRAGNKN